MKKLLLSLFVAVGLCFSAFTQVDDFPVPLEDTEANYYNLYNILSSDKVVVINFWATSDPGSASFSSTLQGIYDSYGSNSLDVIVLSIEITQKPYAALDTWRTTNSVTYPAIGGDGGNPTNGYQAFFYWNTSWKPTLGPTNLPQLVVIHPDAGNPGNSSADWSNPYDVAVVPGDDAAIRASIDGYTGIQNQNLLDGQISIFPNPATDYVNVQFSNRNSEEVEVSVINIIGEQINLPITTSSSNGVNSIRINTSELVNGYYMVQLKTETATKTMRLQIIK